MVRVISFATISERLTVESILDPVRHAFISYSAGEANVPAVQHLEMPYREGGALHIKSGHVRVHDFCVVKIASTFPGNVRRDPPSPSLDGIIAIFSAIDGKPLAIIEDHAWITQLRTAAAGAIVAQLLSPTGARRLGIIGTGAQAKLQASAISTVLPNLTELLVWGRTSGHAEAYVDEMAARLPRLAIRRLADVESLARQSDVLVTATYATEPLVRGAWLPAGVLVIGLGADGVAKQELDGDCIRGADLVIVDSRSQNETLAEIGRGIGAGLWTSDRIDAEIGELLAGQRSPGHPPRPVTRGPSDRVVCKLTGIAAQEIFVCAHLVAELGIL